MKKSYQETFAETACMIEVKPDTGIYVPQENWMAE